MSGGFRETLVNELMVIPTGSPDELLQVVTVMPVGYRAHTRRNSSELMISARVSIFFNQPFALSVVLRSLAVVATERSASTNTAIFNWQ
jgi:hypothetical protein